MIDIHCHLLPWIDDGPKSLEESIAMARVAVDRGTTTIVATPHVNDVYDYDPDAPAALARALQSLLDMSGVPLQIELGAEVAITRALDMDDDELHSLCLGSSRYLLLESPNLGTADMVERTVFELQLRGVRVILGHPERSPIFQDDVDALARLVDRGVLTSVTASALRGRAGESARACATELFEAGLVHNVASDGHSPERRRPDLIGWRAELEGIFHDPEAAAEWMTIDVPAALLAGEDIPPQQFPLKRRWRASGRRRKRVASALAG